MNVILPEYTGLDQTVRPLRGSVRTPSARVKNSNVGFGHTRACEPCGWHASFIPGQLPKSLDAETFRRVQIVLQKSPLDLRCADAQLTPKMGFLCAGALRNAIPPRRLIRTRFLSVAGSPNLEEGAGRLLQQNRNARRRSPIATHHCRFRTRTRSQSLFSASGKNFRRCCNLCRQV